MKADIHPTYYKKVIATCACGTTYELGSTMSSLTTEICAACHPFYTGKQKLIDTAGQVDKFMAKVKKAAQAKAPAKAPKMPKEEAITAELLQNAETKAALVETVPAKEVVVKATVVKKAAVKKPVAKKPEAPAAKPKKVIAKKVTKKPVKKPAKKPVAKKPAAKKAAKKPIKKAKKATKKKTSKK